MPSKRIEKRNGKPGITVSVDMTQERCPGGKIELQLLAVEDGGKKLLEYSVDITDAVDQEVAISRALTAFEQAAEEAQVEKAKTPWEKAMEANGYK